MSQLQLCLEDAVQWLGRHGYRQRSNQEAKGNAQHDATTTMLHSVDGVLSVRFPLKIALCDKTKNFGLISTEKRLVSTCLLANFKQDVIWLTTLT